MTPRHQAMYRAVTGRTKQASRQPVRTPETPPAGKLLAMALKSRKSFKREPWSPENQ